MRTPLSTAATIAATAIAIAVGLVTLLGYLLPPEYTEIRTLILGWAVTLAAVATVVAIINLVMAHWRKLTARRNPDRYSIFTIIFFFITFLAGGAAYILNMYKAEYQQLVVNSIQVPVEASLLAVLSVTLALASFRLFQRRRGVLAVAFFISALVFLLLNSGISALLEMVLPSDLLFVWDNLLGALQILPVAGARGILLGVALGSILAGLRVLFGAERPYNG